MNILWVEDFGAGLPADSRTLVPLFQGVVKREIFNKHWDDEDDLLGEPAILSRFFAKHSLHQIVLLKGVFDYIDRIANDNEKQHDVFIIDINLDNCPDGGRDLPPGMDGVDKATFRQKGGFYIYNHLIRNGAPPENICFLTGEKESTFADFARHCQDALIPPPDAFEKGGGYTDFRAWLQKRQEDPYIALRRAVIEGCEYLKKHIKSGDSVIQFWGFLPKDEPTGRDTRIDIIDYLDTLQAFLPALAHSDNQSLADRRRLEQLYRLFVRALAHEWDAAQPLDTHLNLQDTLRTFGLIMKSGRNWMAHTSLLNQLAADDVAFLFLVNMRAMFKLDPATTLYERALLALISRTTDEPITFPNEDQLRNDLSQSYLSVKQQSESLESNKDTFYFNQIANELIKANKISQEAKCVRLLYQTFWHGLCPPGKRLPSDHREGKNALALHFSFGQRLDLNPSAVVAKNDCLYCLACAIYKRSFAR